MELLDVAQSSEYRKENSVSPQGYNCLMAIIPITTFPYYYYKRLWFKGRQRGSLRKIYVCVCVYVCSFFSVKDAEVANLEPKAIGKL